MAQTENSSTSDPVAARIDACRNTNCIQHCASCLQFYPAPLHRVHGALNRRGSRRADLYRGDLDGVRRPVGGVAADTPYRTIRWMKVR
jgi:hypothetical protein